MRLIFPVFALFIAFFIISCGGDNKQTRSDLSGAIDDEIKFAKSLYGENSVIIARGDLLGSGSPCAIAAIVKQKTDNSYWIEKAGMFRKEDGNWKVILKMEEKLSTPNGELTPQVIAEYGYIISFDTAQKPVNINIVMADKYGKAASDDAVLRWEQKKKDFKFTSPYDDIPQ